MMKKRKNAAKIISDNKYFINYILNKKCDNLINIINNNCIIYLKKLLILIKKYFKLGIGD